MDFRLSETGYSQRAHGAVAYDVHAYLHKATNAKPSGEQVPAACITRRSSRKTGPTHPREGELCTLVVTRGVIPLEFDMTICIDPGRRSRELETTATAETKQSKDQGTTRVITSLYVSLSAHGGEPSSLTLHRMLCALLKS